MNALCQHEEYARTHLKDRAAWLALVDHHEELLDVPHLVALRAVAAIRRQTRRAAELQRAAELLAGDGDRQHQVRAALLAWANVPWAGDGTLYVIEGRRLPRLEVATSNTLSSGPGLTVTVGASVVLWLADLQERCYRIKATLRTDAIGALLGIE